MGPINKKIIFNLNFYDPFNKFLEDAKSKVYIYIYIPSFSTKKKKIDSIPNKNKENI